MRVATQDSQQRELVAELSLGFLKSASLPPTVPAVLMCPLEGVLPMLAGSFLYALDVGASVLEMQSPGVSERRMPNTKGSRQTRNAC
jgi:hypothetical protein